MKTHRIRLTDVASQAWKNGGGLTRELLAYPSAADWQVRISVAEVTADGPFSRFEGVQRWFAVLHGAGVHLRVNGSATTLTTTLTATSAPLAFDGGATTDCTLVDGPTRDFNLMLRGAQGQMQRVQGSASVMLGATDLIAIYAHSKIATATFDSESLVLEPGELLWACLEAPVQFSVLASDALLIHARLKDTL